MMINLYGSRFFTTFLLYNIFVFSPGCGSPPRDREDTTPTDSDADADIEVLEEDSDLHDAEELLDTDPSPEADISETGGDAYSDADADDDLDEDIVDADPDEAEVPCGGCSEGETCCNSLCVDTDTNDLHCGSCNSFCGLGVHCEEGSCRCRWEMHGTELVIDCEPEEDCCIDDFTGFAQCVNLRIGTLRENMTEDTIHCGSCNQGCDEFACRQGECCSRYDEETETYVDDCPTPDEELTPECGGSCGPGATCCDDRCVDTFSDELHCGGCGRECGSGAVCYDGFCHCPQEGGVLEGGTDCRAWGACCSGPVPLENRCVDLSEGEFIPPDELQIYHCGSCNQACISPGVYPYNRAPECRGTRCVVTSIAGLCDEADDCPRAPASSENPAILCEGTHCVLEYDTYHFAF